MSGVALDMKPVNEARNILLGNEPRYCIHALLLLDVQ